MTVGNIISILFILASLSLLVCMTRCDVAQIRSLNYDSRRYYEWITETDEYLTVKRILSLVVFIASVTTMAMDSEWVVAILAACVIAMTVRLAMRRIEPSLSGDRRATTLLITVVAFVIVVTAVVALTTGLYYAGVAAIFLATFSYVVTLAFNECLSLLRRDHSHDGEQ